MTLDTPHIKPLHVVFCDDIRREVTGKEILIGVYSGNLMLPRFPAAIVLATWVPFERVGNHIGKIPVEFRMLNATENNQPVGYGSVEVTISDVSEIGSLGVTALAIMMNHPGKLVFQLKQYDEPWQTMGSLTVTEQSAVPINVSSEPSRPSARSQNAARKPTSLSGPSRRASPTGQRRS